MFRRALLFIFLLSIIISCLPTRHYYKFNYNKYYSSQKSPPVLKGDSILIFEAFSAVDSTELLKYDEVRLEEIAKLNKLKVNYSDLGIKIEKISYNSTTSPNIQVEVAWNNSSKKKWTKNWTEFMPFTVKTRFSY